MKINVIKSVLHANDTVAAANQARLDGSNVLGINLLSAPGSGKTSLLEKTLPALGDAHPSSVLVGDLQTTRDAERIQPYALETVQINTGTGCHLSAVQVCEGLNQLDLDRLSFVFIENVGNMVCPAAFDLGEHLKAVLLSVPEGDDKVAKYPTLFQRADVILLNKIDLLGIVQFNIDRVREDLAQINTRAPLIEISCSTGQGLDEWLTWLHSQRRARVGEQEAPQALR